MQMLSMVFFFDIYTIYFRFVTKEKLGGGAMPEYPTLSQTKNIFLLYISYII